ncbi:G patch domain-containing protein 4 [Drosophila elegans]|uniref:G patch domain-containing protein 4 n=1 Tax=Drosophila elegans TaxID=30023 RepID=UPI0007E5DBCB|nr:G patch domain-containing protein 4 [Drosophila elegans]
MDFAKKILGKYGWKEGDGLGKNNTGIAAPLKASLKFDNAGLGVDRAQEFNDHWWERCFNEAASNVDVQIQQDGQVSTSRKHGEDAVEISTSGFSARKLKKAKEQHASDGKSTYDNFLQTSLLTQNGGEVVTSERIKVEDIEVTKVTVLTDEELFKACGGRTAHKGARHGLKLSGKIARLEQQEREMLEKLQCKLKSDPGTVNVKKNGESSEESPVGGQKLMEQSVNNTVEQPVKLKKMKKARKDESFEEPAVDQLEKPLKTKKKKKDKTKKLEEETPGDRTQEVTEDQLKEPLKIKRKKNNPLRESEESTQYQEAEESLKTKKKRKTEDDAEEAEAQIKSKKKKKNREKDQ